MAAPLLSAGVIPVLRAGSQPASSSPQDWRFLLLRAYNYWDFPKGIVEPSEEPLEAALRELREETGIERTRMSWGNSFYETGPYSGGKIARYYLAEVFDERVALLPSPELGRPEHHEFRWLSLNDALTLLVPRVRQAALWAWDRLSGLKS